jgi:ParB family chromosome partitioning protein
MSLAEIPLGQITPNVAALRKVNTTGAEYLQMRESVREHGIITPISVNKTGENTYELVDGLHRFTAAQEVGLATIPAQIFEDATKSDTLIKQIIANVARVETKPVEFATGLKRLLADNPYMTRGELAKRLGRETSWIDKRLSLVAITDPEIQAMVDEGTIKLSQAFSLALLPESEQKEFVRHCFDQDISIQTFATMVTNRLAELRKIKAAGQAPKAPGFQPVAHLRKFKEVEAVDRVALANVIGNESNPLEAALKVVAWMLHMDPVSIAEGQAKYDAAKAAKEAAKAEKSAAKAKPVAEESVLAHK